MTGINRVDIRVGAMGIAAILIAFLGSSVVDAAGEKELNKGLKFFKDGRFADANIEWRVSAKKGNLSATFNLGFLYESGLGTKQNFPESLKWYRLAAEKGFTKGMNNVGHFYATGRGVKLNYQEAIKWWRRAADKGDSWGTYYLGIAYYHGWGYPRDFSKALRNFEVAYKALPDDYKAIRIWLCLKALDKDALAKVTGVGFPSA